MIMVKITAESIENYSFASLEDNDNMGAYVYFYGKVRKSSEAKHIKKMFYESHTEMAETELRKICNEAVEEFGVHSIRVIHRVGEIEPGETSIIIEVMSSHRKEAFRACEALIDRIKQRVPIWKKEIYDDETEKWVHN